MHLLDYLSGARIKNKLKLLSTSTNFRKETGIHFVFDKSSMRKFLASILAMFFILGAPCSEAFGTYAALEEMDVTDGELQATLSQAGSANGIVADPTVTFVDGIIQGSLRARSARGRPMTYSVVGKEYGGKYGVGILGGKAVLGNVPITPTATDPQSFTFLPYLDEFVELTKSQDFKVKIREVGIGGASLVVTVNITPANLVPAGAPMAFTCKVPSFDGTLISANFYPASGLTGGVVAPTVLNGSSLGCPGNADPYSNSGERGSDVPPTSEILGIAPLRASGYNVATWDPRGQFCSNGTLQFDNPFFEGRDVSAVIDWLSQNPNVALNVSGDPKVGMVGSSYGGTIQLTAASVDPRIDAIVADNAWNSLLDSLYDGEIFKTAYGTVMLKSLCSSRSSVNKQLFTGILSGVRTGRISLTVQAILANSGPTTLLNHMQAPTLLTHSIGNGFVPLDQSCNNAETIYSNPYPTPIKLIWYSDGQDIPDQAATLRQAAMDWLDQYVAGKGSPADSIPKFQWFDDAGSHYVSDLFPFEPSFNELRPFSVESEGGKLIISPMSIRGNVLPASKVIEVPVLLPAGKQVVGQPVLAFSYSGRGSSRAVFARIVESSTGHVLGGSASPVPVVLDGRQHTVGIPLNYISYTQSGAAPGNLILQIIGSVPEFANRRSGVITISDIVLDLPIRAEIVQ
jgi:ABC-2 type transport system ATP-binding protein